MKIDADLHNFGQHVTQIERASGIYFQKPRPVYWEWLFFGNKSPIKGVFVQKIADALFNLDVQFENGDCGFSKQVIEFHSSNDKNAHAYNLGVLIAYSYLFGIRDLHEGNVIRQEMHLQVIDAEVVLSKILLPNETLLLPFKITTTEDCGAKKSFDNIMDIDLHNLELILDGYFDLFSEVSAKREELVSIFNEHREKMVRVPVRHIMRDTIQYRKWLEGEEAPPIAFCENEITQLTRGDVPYYFKFLNDSQLYAYKNQSGDYEAVTAPKEFIKGINRDATDPIELLSTSRIENELVPNGSLYLLKKLTPKGHLGSVDGKNFKAVISVEDIQINLGAKHFKTKK